MRNVGHSTHNRNPDGSTLAVALAQQLEGFASPGVRVGYQFQVAKCQPDNA